MSNYLKVLVKFGSPSALDAMGRPHLLLSLGRALKDNHVVDVDAARVLDLKTNVHSEDPKLLLGLFHFSFSFL